MIVCFDRNDVLDDYIDVLGKILRTAKKRFKRNSYDIIMTDFAGSTATNDAMLIR